MRFARWLVLSLMILAVASATQAPALQPAQTFNKVAVDTSMATYRVVRGTTLWDLAYHMYGNGGKWGTLFDQNVEAGILDSSRLSFDRAGNPTVILTIGTELRLKRNAAANASLLVEAVAETTAAPTDTVDQASVETVASSFNWWPWVLGAILIMAVMMILIALRAIRDMANPVTSGPAIVEGGLTPAAAPDYFRSRAAANGGVQPELLRILEIRRGRGFGLMQVSYADGREEMKRLNGETVFRATVEFPDHHQEEMYCLQGCGNDIRFLGNRYLADRLFRFQPEEAPIYTPPAETVVETGSSEVRITGDELVLTVGGRTVSFGADNWILRKGPDGGIIIAEEGRSPIEFRDGRIRGIELERSAPEPTPTPAAKPRRTRRTAPTLS